MTIKEKIDKLTSKNVDIHSKADNALDELVILEKQVESFETFSSSKVKSWIRNEHNQFIVTFTVALLELVLLCVMTYLKVK